MTAEHDRAAAERLHATPLRALRSYTSADIHALLRDWARHNPPRRFALYRIVSDMAGFDGDVFAWGLAHDNYLVVRSDDERFQGRFVSAQSMLNALSQHPAEIGMVWIDETPNHIA